jgi:hypothetical protein
LLHGADSPPIKAPRTPQTASKVSQSQFCAPIDNLASDDSRFTTAIDLVVDGGMAQI